MTTALSERAREAREPTWLPFVDTYRTPCFELSAGFRELSADTAYRRRRACASPARPSPSNIAVLGAAQSVAPEDLVVFEIH